MSVLPGLPRPAHALVPYSAIVVWIAVLVLSHVVGMRWAVALTLSAAATGAAAYGWTAAERARMRDRADRWIARGSGEAPPDAVLAERRAELVTGRERRMLATTLRSIVESAERPPVQTARAPIHRSAVKAEEPRLIRVAAALADPGVAVTARGVARAHVLVSDAASPIYRCSPGAAEELHQQLIQTLFELERGA